MMKITTNTGQMNWINSWKVSSVIYIVEYPSFYVLEQKLVHC